MKISEKALKTLEELIIYNTKMLSDWSILDKRIENYKKNYENIYENRIKPFLEDYRKESKVIERQMKLAESLFSTKIKF